MEKDTHNTEALPEEEIKSHTTRNTALGALIAAAAFGSAYGLKRGYDHLHEKKLEEGSDEAKSVAAIDSTLKKTHKYSPAAIFARTFATSLFQDRKKPTLRQVSRLLQPIDEVGELLKDRDQLVQAMVESGEDEPAARRLYGQVELMSRMIPAEAKKEARRQIAEKYEVVALNERQWPKIESIVNQHWGFDTLRRQRHLIKPHAPLDRYGVMEPKGWLGVKEKKDGEIVGYGSFFAVEKINPDDPNDENYLDLAKVTWEQLLKRRVHILNHSDIADRTLIVTSVGKEARIPGDEPVGAALFGIIDVAQRYGASNVLGPSFSPFIASRQRSIKHGGNHYFDYWTEKNPRGTLADNWRSLLHIMKEKEYGFNPGLLEGEINIDELLEILSRQRGIQGLTEEKIAALMTQEELRLRKIPISLTKGVWPRWHYKVPAAWLSFYKRENNNLENLPEIYNLVNL